MKLPESPTCCYGAYNRHDAAAVAELYDGNGIHEDIAIGHSKVGQTAIADGLQKFFGWFPDAHWAPHVQIADPFGSVTITYLLTATLQRANGPHDCAWSKNFIARSSRFACAWEAHSQQ